MRSVLKVFIYFSFFFLVSCSEVSEKIQKINPFTNKDVIETDPYANSTDKELYDTGYSALEGKDYKIAAKNFEALESHFPFSQLTAKAQVKLIYAYFMNSDYDSAYEQANQYIQLHPSDKNLDYVYYMKGYIKSNRYNSFLHDLFHVDQAARDVDSLKTAFHDYKDLINRYPNSKYAKIANREVVKIKNLIARHELFIAEYYVDRKAYIAAANRAQYVIANFQGSPESYKALKILNNMYKKLDIPALVKETDNIIALNQTDFDKYN